MIIFMNIYIYIRESTYVWVSALLGGALGGPRNLGICSRDCWKTSPGIEKKKLWGFRNIFCEISEVSYEFSHGLWNLAKLSRLRLISQEIN